MARVGDAWGYVRVCEKHNKVWGRYERMHKNAREAEQGSGKSVRCERDVTRDSKGVTEV